MKYKTITCLVILLGVVGCGGQFETSFEQIQDDLGSVNAGKGSASTDKPYCTVDSAEYLLDTQMVAFELVDKTNISFGFDILKGIFKAFGLKIDAQKGELSMAMSMSETKDPLETIATGNGVGKSSKTDLGFSLDLVKLGLDLNYFRQTPLYDLSARALDNTLANLKSNMNRIETPWHTSAYYYYPDRQQMIIPAGTVAGIKEGDLFKIFNVEQVWEDPNKPCASKMVMEIKSEQLATFQAQQVDKNATLLTLVQFRSDYPIKVGARVEIEQLAPPKSGQGTRQLLRGVRLREFNTHKLTVHGAQDVDLSLQLRELLQPIMNRHGYYRRN